MDFAPLAERDLNFVLTQASVKLVGASSAAIKAELYAVLDEFFDVSSSWQEWLASRRNPLYEGL